MNRYRLVVAIVAAMCSVTPKHGSASVSDASAVPDNGDLTVPNAASPAQLPAPIDVSSTDRAASGNPLWGISIETLHATRERPLFSPSRRPPAPPVVSAPVAPVKVAAPPPPPAAPSLNLLGIVEGNGEAYAVFINTTTHDIVRLKTGEGEDGWVLRSVRGREAVVEKDDRTEVLELPPITGVPK
jgi:general secretion pathway protein N